MVCCFVSQVWARYCPPPPTHTQHSKPMLRACFLLTEWQIFNCVAQKENPLILESNVTVSKGIFFWLSGHSLRQHDHAMY